MWKSIYLCILLYFIPFLHEQEESFSQEWCELITSYLEKHVLKTMREYHTFW